MSPLSSHRLVCFQNNTTLGISLAGALVCDPVKDEGTIYDFRAIEETGLLSAKCLWV